MKTTINIAFLGIAFYVLGFLFVMASHIQFGYQTDMLSEHYRSVLQLFF